MGILKIPDLKDYWSTDVTTNLPFFCSVFSRNRFFQIYGMLHAGEIDGSTKKIQPFLDLYIDRFYSSPQLSMELDTIGVAVTGSLSISYQIYYLFQLGTVMSNRKRTSTGCEIEDQETKGYSRSILFRQIFVPVLD